MSSVKTTTIKCLWAENGGGHGNFQEVTLAVSTDEALLEEYWNQLDRTPDTTERVRVDGTSYTLSYEFPWKCHKVLDMDLVGEICTCPNGHGLMRRVRGNGPVVWVCDVCGGQFVWDEDVRE